MLNYYKMEGKGVSPNFSLTDIEKLASYEEELGQNLAPLVLTGADAEKVASAKEAYKNLRDLYNDKTAKSKAPLLIADLILAEEEEPHREIEAIIHHGSSITPFLIDLLRSQEFYDPLFPGYGHAPDLAAFCLGKLGDKKAIIALFETLDMGDFEHEESTLRAIRALGEPARDFLLNVVKGRPITFDNERAALGLIAFIDDPKVQECVLDELMDPKVRASSPLNSYLALVCERLHSKDAKEKFQSLLNDPKLDKVFKQDILSVIREWGI
jgi:hypothetical protein